MVTCCLRATFTERFFFMYCIVVLQKQFETLEIRSKQMEREKEEKTLKSKYRFTALYDLHNKMRLGLKCESIILINHKSPMDRFELRLAKTKQRKPIFN